MKSRVVNFVAEAFVWTLLSAYVEITVTATVERLSLGDRYVLHDVPFVSLQGHSTTWQWVSGVLLAGGIRGMIVVLDRLQYSEQIFRRWWARSCLVMIVIFTAEYLAGLFFNVALHWNIWDYKQYVWHGIPLHLQGQITLVYVPFYFLAGLFLRPVYRVVHALAPYVGSGVLALLRDPVDTSETAAPATP
jgi:hypothetical protein